MLAAMDLRKARPVLIRGLKVLRGVWVVIGVAFVALYIFECNAGFLTEGPKRAKPKREGPHPVISTLPEETQAMLKEIHKHEFTSMGLLLVSTAVGWAPSPRTQELVGSKHIAYTEDGYRKVLHTSSSPDAKTVWIFGGSNIWGWNASDELTLATQLARELGPDWRVENYSVIGFVATQEFDLFQRLVLEKGAPEYAVFLDGLLWN